MRIPNINFPERKDHDPSIFLRSLYRPQILQVFDPYPCVDIYTVFVVSDFIVLFRHLVITIDQVFIIPRELIFLKAYSFRKHNSSL
jgi:hypothetical protein